MTKLQAFKLSLAKVDIATRLKAVEEYLDIANTFHNGYQSYTGIVYHVALAVSSS